MTTATELYQIVRNVVLVTTTFKEAIIAKQNAPRPKIPYALLDISTLTPVAWRYEKDKDVALDLNRTYTALFSCVMSVQFLKGDAFDQALLFSAGLASQPATDLFNASDIAVNNRASVLDVFNIMDSSYESRAQLDVTLMFTHTFEETITAIDAIKIIGVIDNGATVVENIEINI